jgi:hypothetical protein
MTDNEKNTLEEIEEEFDFSEDEVITLEFDDGTAVDCFIIGLFEAEGKEYIALAPDDGTDDAYIYRYKEVSDDEFEINDIEDDAEYEAVVKVFDELMGVE